MIFVKDFNIAEAKEKFRKLREGNERKSDEIMKLFDYKKFKDLLRNAGNDRLLIMEQIILAALDCHYYYVVDYCTSIIEKEFPGSLRSYKYKIMLMEAKEQYDDQNDHLNNLIQLDKTNAAANKRQVAAKKAQGNITAAIKDLVEYLKKFMSDVEAWQELCELYLQTQEYSRAAFCAEEVILHQPHNHLVHQRLADIRYTMGGVENMELAKTYYCQALKLNPNNMRAALGLFLTTNNLLAQYKSSGNNTKRKEIWKLCQYAQATVLKNKQSEADLSQAMLALAITE